MDIVDAKTRSRMMSGIRNKNTKPELTLRRYLHAKGFRYRLHVKTLPGQPDLVLPKYNLCIFVHGCFWHQHLRCPYATIPKSNTEFWLKKFAININRDEKAIALLLDRGWRVFTIWECGLRKADEVILGWLPKTIKGQERMLTWPEY